MPQGLVDRLERAARPTGYLQPPPGDLIHFTRFHAGESRIGQLADNAQGNPMVWRPAPYVLQHPGGLGRTLAIPTNDEPNTTTARGGAGMDLFRLAIFGAKHVRWGVLIGHHAHWGSQFCRTIDFFLDSADAAGNRREAKFRFERFNNTAAAVVDRWQVADSAGVFVDIPGASAAGGLPLGGLTGHNEGKAGYNIIEFDFDYETGRYLALRVNDRVFGRRLPADHPGYNALHDLGEAQLTFLNSFRYGNNFCIQPNNRNDAVPISSGVYRGKQTLYMGEEYVTVMSYTADREAWS
jgi:hypothetical protein